MLLVLSQNHKVQDIYIRVITAVLLIESLILFSLLFFVFLDFVHSFIIKIHFELKVLIGWSNSPALLVSDYVLEEEARDYVNSVHIEDDPVDKYSLSESPQQEDLKAEIVVEETPAEEASASHQTTVTVQEPPVAAVEEPVAELTKRTYASIVCTYLLLFHLLLCLCQCLCIAMWVLSAGVCLSGLAALT